MAIPYPQIDIELRKEWESKLAKYGLAEGQLVKGYRRRVKRSCPTCGHPTPIDDDFCHNCGEYIGACAKLCAVCRSPLEDTTYCFECGTVSEREERHRNKHLDR